jgi:ribosomal protein L40E
LTMFGKQICFKCSFKEEWSVQNCV